MDERADQFEESVSGSASNPLPNVSNEFEGVTDISHLSPAEVHSNDTELSASEVDVDSAVLTLR